MINTLEQLATVILENISECKVKEQKLTLTIDETTKLSGIGRDKIMELVHRQHSDFPSFKVGSKFLINREMLIFWLELITKEGRVL